MAGCSLGEHPAISVGGLAGELSPLRCLLCLVLVQGGRPLESFLQRFWFGDRRAAVGSLWERNGRPLNGGSPIDVNHWSACCFYGCADVRRA